MKLLKFYNNFCGPCKVIAPLIESYSERVEIVSIDTRDEDNATILNHYRIKAVPTIILDFGDKTVRLQGISEITKKKLDELIP